MMISKFRTAFADESGQGMTEYIIIVALIAIAAIGVVSLFGDNIRKLFGASVKALNGQEGATVDTKGTNNAIDGHRCLRTFANTTKGK